jgi:hypothetical protein
LQDGYWEVQDLRDTSPAPGIDTCSDVLHQSRSGQASESQIFGRQSDTPTFGKKVYIILVWVHVRELQALHDYPYIFSKFVHVELSTDTELGIANGRRQFRATSTTKEDMRLD